MNIHDGYKMIKYRLREDIEAMQFLGYSTFKSFFHWGNGYIGAGVEADNMLLYLTVRDGLQVQKVWCTDWIIKDKLSNLKVLSDKQFKETYEKVEDE